MGYAEWVFRVTQKPFGMGREGLMLTLGTLATLILAFALGGKAFFAMLPAGSYPRILLALPFLLVAAVVFLVFSAPCYVLYKKRVAGETEG
jgi:hypothetical protein